MTAHGAAIDDHMRAHTDREREAARKEAAKCPLIAGSTPPANG